MAVCCTKHNRIVELLGRYSNRKDLEDQLREVLERCQKPEQPAHTVRGKSRQVQRRLSVESVDELVADYQDGVMIRELAEQFGIHRGTVVEHLDRAGVERRIDAVKRRLEEARSLYESGWSLTRVGAHLSVHPETVRRTLKAAGVRLRRRPGWSV